MGGMAGDEPAGDGPAGQQEVMQEYHQFLLELERLIERSKTPPWWDIIGRASNRTLRQEKIFIEPAGTRRRALLSAAAVLRIAVAIALYVFTLSWFRDDAPWWASALSIPMAAFGSIWALTPIVRAQAYRNGYWDASRERLTGSPWWMNRED